MLLIQITTHAYKDFLTSTYPPKYQFMCTIFIPTCRLFDTLIEVGYRYPINSPTYDTNTIVVFTATPTVGVGNKKPNGRNND